MADDGASVATSEASRLFHSARLTQSARPLSRGARGIDALIASFSPLVQNSIRQLLAERAELAAESRELESRLEGVDQPSAALPLVLQEKRHQLDEVAARLQRLAGREAAAVFLEAARLADAAGVDDDEASAQMSAGGDADAAAVASRRHMVAARSAVSSARLEPHDLPTATGGRDVHNARPEDHTSYYQSQQLKYGRGRRGSSSIAGAWAEVLGSATSSGGGAQQTGSPTRLASPPSVPSHRQQQQQQQPARNNGSLTKSSTRAPVDSGRAWGGEAEDWPAPAPADSQQQQQQQQPQQYAQVLPLPLEEEEVRGSPSSSSDAAALLAHARSLLATPDAYFAPDGEGEEGAGSPELQQQQQLRAEAAAAAGRPVSAAGSSSSRSPPAPGAADDGGAHSPRLIAALATLLGGGRGGASPGGAGSSGSGSGSPGVQERRPAARSASAHANRRVLSPQQYLHEQQLQQQQQQQPGGPMSPTGSVGTSISRALPPSHAYHNEGGDTRRSSVVGSHVSSSGGRSSVIAGLSATRAASAIPLPRHTSSAARAAAAPGLAALLASLPGLPAQHAVRELVVDLAELLHRRELIGARLAADPRHAPDEPPPRVLEEVEAGAAERLARLLRLVGRAGVDVVLAAVADPGFKEALGLLAGGTEEDAAAAASTAGGSGGLGGGASQYGGCGSGLLTTDDEEAVARVWRRRLDATKVPAARHAAGGLERLDATASGGRQLWNIIATADPEAPLSYYQKAQMRYGRARRGSTSVAGAWEEVFGAASAASASSGSPTTHQAPAAAAGRSSGGGGASGAASSLWGPARTTGTPQAATASGSPSRTGGRWGGPGPVSGGSPASGSGLRRRSPSPGMRRRP